MSPASGGACSVRARDMTMEAAAVMHGVHAIRGACEVSEGKREEEEHIRARIEVIGQDNYSSRTGQKGKSYVEFAGT
jgi:hypothetical protein